MSPASDMILGWEIEVVEVLGNLLARETRRFGGARFSVFLGRVVLYFHFISTSPPLLLINIKLCEEMRFLKLNYSMICFHFIFIAA
jgi:hypothetical protein